ncbi:MAG: IS110 family transposase [Bacteroidota bacterium]
MKNYEEAVGIDVSKNTLDVSCHHLCTHRVFPNDIKGYRSMISWVCGQTKGKSFFYCFENTGNYSLKLSCYLSSKQVDYVEENPLKIKRSLGLVREKTDKVDSRLIARYAWLCREELVMSEVKGPVYQELGRLLGLRDQLVRNRAGLLGTLKEMEHLLGSPSTDVCCISTKRAIASIDKQIKAIEVRMDQILKQDEVLSVNYKLLLSLRGVGFVVACQLLYHTQNFQQFDSWRKFSSYCGLAPYEHQSGSSLRKRKRCHWIGDRKMKSLLSMASISAIQHDPELRSYYKRKIAEGKPKMLALNNVRNKLLARAFSVVRRGTPYVVLNQYVA